MGESGNGRANGAGVPANRASVPALATQGEVDRCALLSPDDLKRLIVRVLDTKDLDLRPFSCLTPRQTAELIGLPEWKLLVKAMIGAAVLNKDDRWTRSQWRGLAFFGRSIDSPKGQKISRKHEMDEADVIEVEAEA